MCSDVGMQCGQARPERRRRLGRRPAAPPRWSRPGRPGRSRPGARRRPARTAAGAGLSAGASRAGRASAVARPAPAAYGVAGRDGGLDVAATRARGVLGGARDGGGQLERSLVVLHRLLRGGQRHRLVAGLHAGLVRGRQVVRGARVPGQLGGAAVGRARVSVRRRRRAGAPARRAAGRRRPPRRAARGGTRSRARRGRLEHVRVDRLAQRGVQDRAGQIR